MTRLQKISIPGSVTEIGNSAFDNCFAVKEVSFEDGDNKLKVGYKAHDYYKYGIFYDCPIRKVYFGRNLSYLYSRLIGRQLLLNWKLVIKSTYLAKKLSEVVQVCHR